jgi:hypothetical protein
MKWKKELQTLNLSQEQLSVSLKNKIKDYESIAEGIEELQSRIANPTLNDDVDEMNVDLEELIEGLEIADRKLVSDIQKFDRNKEKYAMLTDKMKQGREAKAKAKTQGSQTPPPPKQAPQVQTNVVQTDTPEPNSTKEEKKGGGFGWIAFAVLAGIVTLGAVNLMKRNDS